uniref:Uncharacterized protein AlNc14C32G2960 n=1 Tax=Albugo laibachii Nc14 TaxID=890382 RepID=F0W810_9STRA|nr:conserved hypothetical protein [Albugo laibachii Nc14]|eukprot:CCA17263.1 conserved hypothetical protein [Albugo laibachii Nc14]
MDETRHEGLACQVNEDDAADIMEQLGFIPNNLVKVASYIPKGDKHQVAVVLLYPLKSDLQAYKVKQRTAIEPFPTIYWLVSKDLKARVSLLESQGKLQEIQHKLKHSVQALESIKSSHEQYASMRWSMLTENDKLLVEKMKWKYPLEDVGIGGIQEFTYVKCLHVHYAHYLASDGKENIIGRWVQELLDGQISPVSQRC